MTTHKVCPPGYTLRKSYIREYRNSIKNKGFTVRRKGKLFTVKPTVNLVRVSSGCVKTRRAKGISLFGKLRKGDLIKYGYQYRLSDRLREKALKKAMDVYGALSVYHKLDAVAKLTVRTAPDASRIFSRDREWVRTHYVSKK
jgi:hypothetical protein